MIKSPRAPVLVTLVLLLIRGLVCSIVITLMSRAPFPSQTNDSIIYVDGQIVGAKSMDQDFIGPRFVCCRPSACQYDIYTMGEGGNKSYSGGSEYADVAFGSNNYGTSGPALVECV